MIDHKMLDKWEEKLRPALTATFPADDALELIKLARLGLNHQVLDESVKVLVAALEEISGGRKLLDSQFRSLDRVSIAVEALAKVEQLLGGVGGTR